MKLKKIIPVFISMLLCAVTICALCVSASAAAVSISKTTDKLIIGETDRLFLTGVTSAVTWTTSDSGIVTVKDGVIRGTGKGTATVTAKYGYTSYSCKVTVGEYRIGRASAKVAVGNRLELSLVGWYGPRTWTTADRSVATVDSDGVVRGISAGKTKISVTFNGKTMSLTVTVTDYVFPISASKVAYIKFSPRTTSPAAYKNIPELYITDKVKIKNIVSFASMLDYSFVDPTDYSKERTMSYNRYSINQPEAARSADTLIFYDSAGKELGRYESPVDSDDAQNVLSTFRYSIKAYMVTEINELINEIFDWLSYDELIEEAMSVAELKYHREVMSVEKISYFSTVNGFEGSLYYSGSYVARAQMRLDNGTTVTVYINPVNGKSAVQKDGPVIDPETGDVDII